VFVFESANASTTSCASSARRSSHQTLDELIFSAAANSMSVATI